MINSILPAVRWTKGEAAPAAGDGEDVRRSVRGERGPGGQGQKVLPG